MLFFLISICLLVGTAWNAAKLARVRSLAQFTLVLLLLPMAELVLVTQVLNLVGWLTSIAVTLATQAFLFGSIFAAARKWGDRNTQSGFGAMPTNAWAGARDLLKDPILVVWMAVTAAIYLFNLLVTIVVPPNNNDALSTHIARIGFWLRHGNLAAWETDRWYQLIYPANAQLVLFWQALFLRSDQLFGALQWVSAVGAGVAVYALSRQLAFDRKAAMTAGLSMLAFPVVLFQSTTTQNDLVMTFALLTAAVFAMRAAQGRELADLALFTIALAFAFGIKQTFFFFAPTYLLFGGWAFFEGRKALTMKGWAVFALAAALLFTLFGVNKYVENARAYGNPFGPAEVLDIQTNQQSITLLPAKFAVNSLRAAYGAIDPAGLPDPLFGYFHKARAALFGVLPIRAAMEGSDFLAREKVFLVETVYTANEDTAQFGPAYLLLLWVSVFAAGKRATQGDKPARFILIGSAAAYVLLILMRPGWDEFQARYMIPVVGLLLPTWGGALSKTRLPWRLAYVCLATLSLYSCAMYNPAKPVLGKDAANMNIWTSDRVTMMMAQNRSLAGSARLVETWVPVDVPLGVFAAKDYHFQYPFFGVGFTRDVVPIIDETRLTDSAWLATNHLNYLLVRVRDGEHFTRPPVDYYKVDAMEGWRLYQRVP